MEPLKPYISFDWSTTYIDPKLKSTLASKEILCIDSTGPYKTVLGNYLLIPGNISYWEIKILKGAYFKIGVIKTAAKAQVIKGSFSDTDDGWSFLSIGELRHNSDKTGKIYGTPYSVGDTVGVLFDQFKGKLGYFINNKYSGDAFIDKNFAKDTFYPAISVLVKGEKFSLNSAERED